MKKSFQVLNRQKEFDTFYFCCCQGYELKYYDYPKNNLRFNDENAMAN